jgi:heme exporter protein B
MGYRIELVGWFVLLLAAGGYTLAVEATIVAAIIARAQGRGALFPVLALPLLLALLVFLIEGTTATAEGSLESVRASLRAVASLGGAMTVVSAMLFPLVWND